MKKSLMMAVAGVLLSSTAFADNASAPAWVKGAVESLNRRVAALEKHLQVQKPAATRSSGVSDASLDGMGKMFGEADKKYAKVEAKRLKNLAESRQQQAHVDSLMGMGDLYVKDDYRRPSQKKHDARVAARGQASQMQRPTDFSSVPEDLGNLYRTPTPNEITNSKLS
jgi:hypothetical protein